MIMTGRNEIHYCAHALMRIIERHLNTTQGKTTDDRITVSSVRVAHDGGCTTYIATVTTDKEEVK